MPFKSEKQRRYMWSQHPQIARRWADEEKRDGKKKRAFNPKPALKGLRNAK